MYGPAEGYRYDGLYTVEEVRTKRARNRLFDLIHSLVCRRTWQQAFMASKSANSHSRQVEPLVLWAARAEGSRNSVFLDSRLFVSLMAMTMRRTSIATIAKRTRTVGTMRPTTRKSRARPMVVLPMSSESPAILVRIMIYYYLVGCFRSKILFRYISCYLVVRVCSAPLV